MISQFFQSLEPRMLLSAGALDTSFGEQGIETIASRNYVDGRSAASAMQSDGTTLLAGNGTIARLLASGKLDPSFGGGNGQVSIGFPGHGHFDISSIVIDGSKILAGGTIYDNDYVAGMGVARLRPDGSLDRSFGYHGFAIADAFNPTYFGSLGSLAITPDGKILAGGAIPDPSNQLRLNFLLVRLNANGSVDRTFGRRGRVVTLVADPTLKNQFNGGIHALAVAADGKIVAAGAGTDALELVRYNADGSLDTSFNRYGLLGLYFPSGELNAVAVRRDGEIFATGGNSVDLDGRRARALTVLAVTALGRLDQHFADHGIARVYVLSTRRAPSKADGDGIELLNDGKLLLSGSVTSAYGSGPFLARLNRDGSSDATFGQRGVAMLGRNAFSYSDSAAGVLVQRDGQVVLPFAASYQRGLSSLHAARFTADGTIIKNYAYGRRHGLSIPLTTLADNAVYDAALGPGGSIFRLGRGQNFDYLLDRYTPSGAIDPFAAPGHLASGAIGLANYPETLTPTAIAAQPDGKILIVSDENGSPFSYLPRELQRYNTDGALDTSFGVNGTVILSNLENAAGDQILVRPDGSIVIFAQGRTGFDMFFYTEYVVLVDANGNVLQSNVLPSPPGTNSFYVGTAVQTSDGKFMVSAGVREYVGDQYREAALIERLNADLTLDTSFSTGGMDTVDPLLFSASAMTVATSGDVYVQVDKTYTDTFIIRLAPDGSFDRGFIPVTGLNYSSAFIAEPDGKLITAQGDGTAIRFTRYNLDGSPDTSFGSGGQSEIMLGGGVSLKRLLLQNTPSGTKLLAIGTLGFEDYYTNEAFLLRLDL